MDIVNSISSKNIERIIRKLQSFETRHSLSDTLSETKGIGAARRWIFNEFNKISQENQNRLKVYYQTFMVDRKARGRRPAFKVLMKNVVAELPGANPALTDRAFVIGGHYDSIAFGRGKSPDEIQAPGANDDATGVAIAMELARVMSKYRFDATVIFVAFAGEEEGLFGSSWFAQEASKKNMRIDGMIANDIVGNIEGGNGDINNKIIRCFSEDPWDSPSRQLARYIRRTCKKYVEGMEVLNIFRNDRYGRGGDHTPFNIEGYAAVRFTELNENYDRQHSNRDIIDFVSIPYVTKVCKTTGAAFASLALAPEAPSNVRVRRSYIKSSDSEGYKRGYNTIISWEHPFKEQDLAGFKIAIRETTSPYYQYFIPVGKVKKYEVKGYSIDNYSFGVLAFDEDGNESLISVPPPLPKRKRVIFIDK